MKTRPGWQDPETPGGVAADSLRRAAFGDRTGVDVAAALSQVSQQPAARQRNEWLAAVVLGARGRYAAAAALLDPLRAAADPVLASLAASALASQRRQLGGHAAARVLDATALGRIAPLGHPEAAESDGVDAAGARHDAVLGLAADAVGRGVPSEAVRLLTVAGREGAGWRGRVRAAWVSAECHLATGDRPRAVRDSERAFEDARSVGAARHRAKSGLVLAAALAAEGTERGRRRARALATEVLESSLERVFLPLAWPSALLLADLLPERARDYRRTASDALSCIFHASDPVGRRLAAASPWMPGPLLQTGDGAPANG
ncbi:MAG: hypothetical protein ACRDO8_09450 [Nocardioidaceae bacterium]